jgi:hypothetical protein
VKSVERSLQNSDNVFQDWVKERERTKKLFQKKNSGRKEMCERENEGSDKNHAAHQTAACDLDILVCEAQKKKISKCKNAWCLMILAEHCSSPF